MCLGGKNTNYLEFTGVGGQIKMMHILSHSIYKCLVCLINCVKMHENVVLLVSFPVFLISVMSAMVFQDANLLLFTEQFC